MAAAGDLKAGSGFLALRTAPGSLGSRPHVCLGVISVIVSILVAGVLMTEAAAAPPTTTVAPATVTGQPAPPAVSYAPPKAADQKDDQIVCRSEAVLGSRLPVRRCRTVHDIKDRMLQDQQAVDRAQANLQTRSN